jgi:transcriptional regulator of arginine metabolism
MKNARQNKILELIDEYEISTQEALIQKLAEHGFDSTQTTISRDIRQLRLIKGPTGRGTYKYVAPEVRKGNDAPGHNSALTDAVLKIEAAQNLIVIKTMAGMANAIAVCVDSLHIKDIIGSVAGDDTMLLVLKTNEKADAVEAELKSVFGH